MQCGPNSPTVQPVLHPTHRVAKGEHSLHQCEGLVHVLFEVLLEGESPVEEEAQVAPNGAGPEGGGPGEELYFNIDVAWLMKSQDMSKLLVRVSSAGCRFSNHDLHHDPCCSLHLGQCQGLARI